MQGEAAIGTGSHANLMGFAVEQDAESMGGDFDRASVQRHSVQDDFPSVVFLRELYNASLSSQENPVLHGKRSDCCRRASRFQPDMARPFDCEDETPL